MRSKTHVTLSAKRQICVSMISVISALFLPISIPLPMGAIISKIDYAIEAGGLHDKYKIFIHNEKHLSN